MDGVVKFLQNLNMVLLPLTIGVCLVSHLYYTIMTIIHVDARPSGSRAFPANNRKNWLVRLLLVAGIVMSVSFGYGSFQILEAMDLAHVKKIEYLVIVLPIQVNFGLLFGSVMQWKIEKRVERRRLAATVVPATAESVTLADEKRPLMEV